MAQAPTSSSSTPFSFGFQLHQTPKPQPPKPKKSPRKRGRKQQPEPVATEEKTKDEVAPLLTTESISQLLDSKHLNAAQAVSLHDLQCNGAQLLIQAFLEYPNLRRCVGLDTGIRYSTAEKNVRALVRNGHNGRQFVLVENMQGKKLTIIEKDESSNRFKKGDIVLCFKKLGNDSTKRENYQGIITKVYDGGASYDVKMTAGVNAQKISRDLIFAPGTERVLEIAAKRYLFEREDSFKAHLVVLPPNDNNAQLHRFLFEYISKQLPHGGRLLCASALHEWDGFPAFELRPIDANVYENDTVMTQEGSIARFHMYEHVTSRHSPTYPSILIRNIREGTMVRIRDDQNVWHTARVLSVDVDEAKSAGECLVEKINWSCNQQETVALDSARIHLIRQRFNVGDIVAAYWPRLLTNAKEGMDPYELFYAQVIERNDDGTYQLIYEDADIHRNVEETWMFRTCEFKFREHDRVLIDSRYLEGDENDVSIPHDTQIDAIVRRLNPDGTYRVRYENGLSYHDRVLESWMQPIRRGEETMNGLLPVSNDFDITCAALWRPKLVGKWASICGFELESEVLVRNGVNGVCLFSLNMDILMNEPLNFPQDRAHRFMMLVRHLRKAAGFKNEEDAAVYHHLRTSITNTRLELTKQESKRKQTAARLHSLLNENRTYMAYEEKLKCIDLRLQGKSKKEIAQKLSKTTKWVTKHWKMEASELQKPEGGSEIDFLKQEVRQLDDSIKHHKQTLEQQQEQIKQYEI